MESGRAFKDRAVLWDSEKIAAIGVCGVWSIV